MNQVQTILLRATNAVLGQLAAFLPVFLGALVTFLIGLLLANWARRLTVAIVRAARVDSVLKNTGIQQFLKKSQLSQGVEEFIGQLVRWVILLIFFIATMNLLGLTTVSQVLGQILGYVPSVVSATLIVAIGVFVAGLLEGVVKGALTDFNRQTARLLGKVTSYTIMVFSILAAVSELRIAAAFIQTLFTGFVAMLALGFGLAIGLGSKDTVAKMMEQWYRQIKS